LTDKASGVPETCSVVRARNRHARGAYVVQILSVPRIPA
jgi:hypothetical protein